MTTEPMQTNSTNELTNLARRLDALEQEVFMLRDAHEIANLQARYLYYLQAHQYDKIVETVRASGASLDRDGQSGQILWA